MRGMLSGEGLFLLTVEGTGLLLLSSFGAIHAKELAAGEEYIVDTGHIVAFESGVEYRIEKATREDAGRGRLPQGNGAVGHGRRGLRLPLPWPGRIYIQTRQLGSFVTPAHPVPAPAQRR